VRVAQPAAVVDDSVRQGCLTDVVAAAGRPNYRHPILAAEHLGSRPEACHPTSHRDPEDEGAEGDKGDERRDGPGLGKPERAKEDTDCRPDANCPEDWAASPYPRRDHNHRVIVAVADPAEQSVGQARRARCHGFDSQAFPHLPAMRTERAPCWSSGAPAPTYQKVRGSNPFGRADGNNVQRRQASAKCHGSQGDSFFSISVMSYEVSTAARVRPHDGCGSDRAWRTGSTS
jgi:hypothetical protein